MAQGNELESALCSLYRGDPRDAEHVAFARGTRGNEPECLRQHANAPAGARDAMRLGLDPYIDHASLPARIEMRQAPARLGLRNSAHPGLS
jgi:hypothetical protein